VIVEAHDHAGHRGIYAMWGAVSERFWWPTLESDVKWYKDTCHECQTMSTEKILLPPTISVPATLFAKCHIDTMHLLTSSSFKYIIQAQCSLTTWPEFQKLKKETARTVGSFIVVFL